jgi:hypothetical protein
MALRASISVKTGDAPKIGRNPLIRTLQNRAIAATVRRPT